MGHHPKYLEVFLRAHHLLMHGDGPLAFNVRVYIAILVSGPLSTYKSCTILHLLPIWPIIPYKMQHCVGKLCTRPTCIYGNNCPCVLGIIWGNLYNPCYQMTVIFSGGEGSLAVAVLNFKSCCTSHAPLCDRCIGSLQSYVVCNWRSHKSPHSEFPVLQSCD